MKLIYKKLLPENIRSEALFHQELQELLGLSQSQIYRKVVSGQLPKPYHYQSSKGKLKYWIKSEILNWMDNTDFKYLDRTSKEYLEIVISEKSLKVNRDNFSEFLNLCYEYYSRYSDFSNELNENPEAFFQKFHQAVSEKIDMDKEEFSELIAYSEYL